MRLELPTDGHGRRGPPLPGAGSTTAPSCVDPAPSFYVYRMTASGSTTTGVLGALTLEEPGAGILPHERTTTKDKADRLGILTETRVNLSPIWGLSAMAAGSPPPRTPRASSSWPAPSTTPTGRTAAWSTSCGGSTTPPAWPRSPPPWPPSRC